MKKVALIFTFIISSMSYLSSVENVEQAFCNSIAAQDFLQSGNMEQEVNYTYLASNIINLDNIQMARSSGCSSTCSSGCSVQCSMTCSMRCGR